MTYASALQYLYSFFNLEKVSHFEYKRELNLERMRMLAGWFGHPERRYPSILVGGTKGKGSAVAFLESILRAGGFRTGMYTSPHLLDFRERIRVNGKMISKPELAKLVSKVKKTIEKRRREIRLLKPITFFEISTLIAFLHFAQKKIDWAVLEVGMGGRLDATTIVNPNLSVMMPISLDHQEHLGNTIAKIAKDKSMIVRRFTPFVSSKQTPEAKSVLQKRCRSLNIKGLFLGKDFQYRIRQMNLNGSTFDFKFPPHPPLSPFKGERGRGEEVVLRHCQIRLPGDIQAENASVAVAGIDALNKHMKLGISESQIKKGLLSAKWPGRFEVINRKGSVFILDGAHNDASIDALVRNLRRLLPKKKIQVIFGASREKDLAPMLKSLGSVTKQIIFTKADQPRAQDLKVMMESGKHYFHTLIPASNAREAVQYSDALRGKNSVTVITGSLFLVAEAKKILKL